MENKASEKAAPEVLAPAGSTESVYAAVRCGADGVYAGGRRFSARANAVNFSREELAEAVKYCHLHGVKLYRAMNTCILDSECREFYDEVIFSAEAGVDGLIIQDMGGAYLARLAVPDMPLHCSTQMTAYTPLGVKKALEAGFCRVVPARELPLEKIRELCGCGAEIEVFVHGAQCMCLSGQCYMSAVIGSRSANRGQCAQSCRLPFSASGQKGERYDLSLKDMSYVPHIKKLREAGAASLKIEGRMKRPEYTAAAVTAVKNALSGNDRPEDMKRLEAVFSRSGFTDGYLTGKCGREMFGYRRKEDVSAAEKVLPVLSELYREEIKDCVLDFELTAEENTPAELSFSSGEIHGRVTGAPPEKARTRPLSQEDAQKQLSKLGGTRYTAGKISLTLKGNKELTLPVSEINRMRRKACAEADRLFTEKNTPRYSISPAPFAPPPYAEKNTAPLSLRIRTDSADIPPYVLDRAELVIMPVGLCEKLGNEVLIKKAAAELPALVTDEKALIKRLEALKEKGVVHFYCMNFTHIGTVSALKDVHIHGGQGLNVTNSFSVMQCREFGIEDIILSFELKAAQIRDIRKYIPAGIIARGHLPLMTVKNCPIRAAAGCKGCRHIITDRTGRQFPVKCREGYSCIYNCDILETSDILNEFGDISFGVIDLSGDMRSDVTGLDEIFHRYENRLPPEGKFTRGLYRRGII